MTLVKYIPNTTQTSIFNDFDNILNNLFCVNNTSNSWSPSFSVTENSKNYSVYADMPGMEKKDLTIEIEDGVFSISGERKVINENESSYSSSGRYGKFKRSFDLPANCDGENTTAKLKNGVLTLSLPKVERVCNIKKISIK